MLNAPPTVWCPGRRHRVKLDPKRFWARAACPVCRNEVDRFRVRRALALIWRALLHRERAILPPAVRRAVGLTTIFYLAILVAVAATIRFGGDTTRIGMLLLFAPRHWFIWPALALVPLAWATAPRLGLAATATAWLALFPVANFEIPTPWRPHAERTALRLVTYNTDRTPAVAWRLRSDLEHWNADVVLLQACKTETADSARAIAGLFVHVNPEFCILSRLTPVALEEMPVGDDISREVAGHFGKALRLVVEVDGRQVAIYAVHLQSPRNALWAALQMDLSQLSDNLVWRSIDSRRIANWINPADSVVIVAGDFNLPMGSAILRQDWGRFRNAFVDAGWGLGHTMFAGKHAIRIDHLLFSPPLAARSAQVLRGYPTEHQPLLVELGWRQ
ncbi:MAG: endonuclease/exonuclease/phosphatase family protein [Gemmatimonadales bacterium]|nr:endonuclease/exonuclease/phosphatase family protein [Gemmatimonadales bacterium]MDZ4390780.1 endonuclease/exonuclease/phosphatase family protein [Gemmatimonadales bacterium]